MEVNTEKRALTAAERQAKRRHKAESEGLKSCSVGLVKVEHVDAFKEAAKASRNGLLELHDGELMRPIVKREVKEVLKKVPQKQIVRVIDLEPLAANGVLLALATALGALLGGLVTWALLCLF